MNDYSGWYKWQKVSRKELLARLEQDPTDARVGTSCSHAWIARLLAALDQADYDVGEIYQACVESVMSCKDPLRVNWELSRVPVIGRITEIMERRWDLFIENNKRRFTLTSDDRHLFSTNQFKSVYNPPLIIGMWHRLWIPVSLAKVIDIECLCWQEEDNPLMLLSEFIKGDRVKAEQSLKRTGSGQSVQWIFTVEQKHDPTDTSATKPENVGSHQVQSTEPENMESHHVQSKVQSKTAEPHQKMPIPIKEKIMAFMETVDDATTEQLHAQQFGKKRSIHYAIDNLMAEKRLERVGKGVYRKKG